MLYGLKKDLADLILVKVLQFGSFRFKHHEDDPNVLLAPNKFNFRHINNPNPGLLDDRDCELVALCMWQLVQAYDLIFSAICGLPRAGLHLVSALSRIVPRPRGFRFFPLTKTGIDGKRRVIPVSRFVYSPNQLVLLFDDVVSGSLSKQEGVRAIESVGSKVAAIIVPIDREEGGREILEEMGYRVLSVLGQSEILAYSLEIGKITAKNYADSMEYMRFMREFRRRL